MNIKFFNFSSLITILLLPSVSFGSGDACEDQDRFEYYRATYDYCSEDLKFLEIHNDSQGIFNTLTEIFPNQENIVGPLSEDSKSLDVLLSEIGYSKPVDQSKLSSWINLNSTIGFIDSIRDMKPIEARNELIESRINLQLDIEKEYERIKNLSFDASEWQYQKGALAFYSNRLKEAKDILCNIGESSNPWSREASLYTCARISMRLAQENWHGYQPIESIDLSILSESEETLKKYLEQYPLGIYRRDAVGLLRRVAFLGNRHDDYLNLLAEAISDEGTSNPNVDLVGELDRYVVRRFNNSFGGTSYANSITHFLDSKLSIVLKSAIIFFYLRSPAEEALPVITNWIEVNSSELNKYEGLKELLVSALLYSKKELVKVLEISHSSTHLELSLGILEIKAKALDELKRFDDAIKIRLQMVDVLTKNNLQDTKERVRFGILRSIVSSKNLELLIHSTEKPYEIKKWAVNNVIQYFMPILEQKELCENSSKYGNYSDIACLSLVRRYLYALDFGNAFKFHKLTKDKALLGPVSKELEKFKSSDDPNTSLKIATAEFIKQDLTNLYIEGPFKLNGYAMNFFDSIDKGVASIPSPAVSPIDIFKDAMASSQTRNNKEDESRAIVGILRCFRSSNSSPSCGNVGDSPNQFPIESRKNLFKRLKSELRGTSGEKSLDIYW